MNDHESAIKQLEEDNKSFRSDIYKKIADARNGAYDGRGRYRGALTRKIRRTRRLKAGSQRGSAV